jgi:hypothetical protein
MLYKQGFGVVDFELVNPCLYNILVVAFKSLVHKLLCNKNILNTFLCYKK